MEINFAGMLQIVPNMWFDLLVVFDATRVWNNTNL
jgi:hypothetical protein